MALEKVMGGFTGYDLTCDYCSQTTYLDFDWDSPFDGVIFEIRKLGWKSFKDEDGEWNHICPDCQEKKRARIEIRQLALLEQEYIGNYYWSLETDEETICFQCGTYKSRKEVEQAAVRAKKLMAEAEVESK